MPDYSTWTDDALVAEQAALAARRTETRLAQVAIAAELDIRNAIAQLSPSTREVFRIRLGGGIAPAGDGQVEPIPGAAPDPAPVAAAAAEDQVPS